jgi:flagellar operon protein
VSVELNPALLPPGAVSAPQPASSPARAGGSAPAGPAFADVLKDAAGTTGTTPLRFSKHAVERAQRRGIPLDPSTLSRLQEGVGRIAGKGSRDSLVLVDGNAFVVSVPNRTVITAVGSAQMREHVFTNIDSAVIA